MKKTVQLFKFLSILGVLCILVANVNAQINYAKQMAATIMNQYKDSMVVKKYASHLEQDKLIAPGQTAEQVQQSRPANWNYEMGVVLTGFEKLAQTTGEKKYTNYTKNIIDHFITPTGDIRTYNMEEYNIDNIPTGRQLLHLYQSTKEEKEVIQALWIAILHKVKCW